ncbi:hypothetical protein D3C86_1310800 [compost metagenome]
MLQTVDVGTEGRTRLTDLLGEGVQLAHGGGCLGLVADTGDNGSTLGAFACTVNFFQSRCQTTASCQSELFIGATTNLEGHVSLERSHGTRGATEQILAAKGSIAGDIVQLGAQLGELGIHRLAIFCGAGAVRRLSGQILHALNDVAHLVHGALGSLHHGDSILGVAHAHFLAAGLGLQTGGHLQTGGVIGGGVDAQTGTQTLHGGAQHLVGGVQLALGGQGSEVGMNGQAHGYFLDLGAALQLVR